MSTARQPKEAGHLATEVTERALIPAEQKTQEIMEAVLGGVTGPVLHNFPGDKPNQWKFIAKAESADMLDRDALGDTVIEAMYFYATRVTVNGNTPGELVETTRCVLMDKDGKGVAFVSDGITRSLARLIQTFGLAAWNPPIKLRITTIKTRKGFRTFAIVPA